MPTHREHAPSTPRRRATWILACGVLLGGLAAVARTFDQDAFAAHEAPALDLAADHGHDQGLSDLVGIVRMLEQDPVRARDFVRIDDTLACLRESGVRVGELSAEQLERLAEWDAPLLDREVAARIVERAASFRAIAATVAVGDVAWFSDRELKLRSVEALRATDARRHDRLRMVVGGPFPDTSRIVQLFRRDHPERFAKAEAYRAARDERRRLLRGQLGREGLLPAR